jgi:ribosomal protein S11
MAKAQQASAKTVAKKRVVKVDTHGDVHVSATFNNIIISIPWFKEEHALCSTGCSTGVC